MPIQIIISFLAFVSLSGITPGPANLTSLATSLTYGRNIALKQWTGLLFGAMTDAMISVVMVYFLGTTLNNYVKWFSFLGAAYLIYLAIHFLRSSYSETQKNIKAPGFLTGYLLQLTNVKIIITCIASLSAYVLPNSQNFFIILIFGLLLGIIQPTCNLVWLFTGAALQKFFLRFTKIINLVMAILLFLCAISLCIMPFKEL